MIHNDWSGNPRLEEINTEIAAAVYTKDIAKASQLFEQIFAEGMTPTTFSCRSLIKGYSKSEEPAAAFAVYDRMVLNRIPLDLKTYNTLISACGSAKDLDRALNFYCKIKEAGLNPDRVTFNCLLNVCAKTQNFVKAKELFDSMNRKKLVRDQITYNTMIKVCVATNQPDEEKKILRMMKKA